MEIEKFLEQFIEGYLFSDIENMLKIELPKGKNEGACGYPIMMTVLAGMELLGDLLSKQKIKPKCELGNKNFLYFWYNYFCRYNPKYNTNNGGKIARVLIRHGLAHRFLTLPGIFITIGRNENHWTANSNEKQIIIDAKEFYFDFKNTYLNLIKTKKNKFEMQNKLNQIFKLYTEDSEKLFEEMKFGINYMTENGLNISRASTMGSPAFTIRNEHLISPSYTPLSAAPSGIWDSSVSGNFPILKSSILRNLNPKRKSYK